MPLIQDYATRQVCCSRQRQTWKRCLWSICASTLELPEPEKATWGLQQLHVHDTDRSKFITYYFGVLASKGLISTTEDEVLSRFRVLHHRPSNSSTFTPWLALLLHTTPLHRCLHPLDRSTVRESLQEPHHWHPKVLTPSIIIGQILTYTFHLYPEDRTCHSTLSSFGACSPLPLCATQVQKSPMQIFSLNQDLGWGCKHSNNP